MDKIEHLTREELVSLVRGLTAECDRRSISMSGQVAPFPVFGERERWEFETSPWPIRIFERESLKFLAVNAAAVKFYGYTREEFLALTPLDIRHPEEHEDFASTLAEPSGYLRHLRQRRHIKKSGEILVVEMVVQDILFNGRQARLTLTIDVSGQVRALEMLHQRDQAFTAMVENSPDVTARFDRELRYLYASSAIAKLTGLEPGVFIGKTNQELGMPDELAAVWGRSLKLVFESALEQRLELSYPSSMGIRYFDARLVPEFDADRKVATVLSIARDITERKKYELVTQRNLALTHFLESLTRAANEAMTPEAAMSACLELVCKHDGWDLGRVVIFESNRHGDTTTRSAWFASDRQRFLEFICVSSSRNHGGHGNFISRVLREQAPVWIEDLQAARFNRKLQAIKHGIKTGFAFPIIVRGEVFALMEVFSTQRRPQDPLMMDAVQTLASQLSRLVERELTHESNARLATIVESSQDAIISRAVDGTILTWNAGAERLFGYSAAEIVGRNIELITPVDLREETARRRVLLMQGVVFQGFETIRVNKDGRRIDVSQCVSPIRDARGEIFAVSNIMRDITEYKRAERELQRQKKLLDAIIENLPVSVVVKDAKTLRLVMVNRVAEETSLLGMEQSIGKTVHELFPQEQADAYQKTDREALESGLMVEIPELEAIDIAGDKHIRHTRKIPIFSDDGKPWVLVGIGEDITDRKKTEDELKRQKKLLDTIIEHLPVGVVVKDTHTMRYLLRNRMANQLTGLDTANAIGKRASEMYPPELAELITASDTVALASGGVVVASPLIVRSATGRIVRNLKVPVADESAQYTHIVTILDDVTDIEQTQAALRRSEQRLTQLISMSPAAIFSFSLEQPFQTTFISEYVTAQVGWRPSEFTGSKSFWSEHIHPDDRVRTEAAVSRILSDGKYHCEYRFLHKDGSWRWMRDEGRTVCDESGGAYEAIGSWMDVTAERVEAEMRVQRALLQRDTLVREVHHRIKNNIQGVIGLLRRKKGITRNSASVFEEAITQLQTIAMVYGLEGKRPNTPLSLAVMLDSICALAENLAGENVVKTYQTESQQPLLVIVEEAVAVAVALNELIINALKHQAADAGKKKVRIALYEKEGVAEIRITNRGGLPPQFDFEQGHGVNDGLDLVKSLLLQPGSEVIFNSGDGEVEVVLNLKPPLLATRAAADTMLRQ